MTRRRMSRGEVEEEVDDDGVLRRCRGGLEGVLSSQRDTHADVMCHYARD